MLLHDKFSQLIISRSWDMWHVLTLLALISILLHTFKIYLFIYFFFFVNFRNILHWCNTKLLRIWMLILVCQVCWKFHPFLKCIQRDTFKGQILVKLVASADLEVQLVQLNHCDGEYSNYWNTLLRNLKLSPYINFYV